MDFTYCRTWAGFVYVAFILDVFVRLLLRHGQGRDHRGRGLGVLS